MKYCLILLFTVLALRSAAQTDSIPKPPLIYQFVEQMPTTGYSINEYISKTIHYPNKARRKGIQGRVIIKFIVNEDGSISDAKVVRGVDKKLDEEALRVVKKMPPWKPGKQNGIPVKTYFTQPISFKLE